MGECNNDNGKEGQPSLESGLPPDLVFSTFSSPNATQYWQCIGNAFKTNICDSKYHTNTTPKSTEVGRSRNVRNRDEGTVRYNNKKNRAVDTQNSIRDGSDSDSDSTDLNSVLNPEHEKTFLSESKHGSAPRSQSMDKTHCTLKTSNSHPIQLQNMTNVRMAEQNPNAPNPSSASMQDLPYIAKASKINICDSKHRTKTRQKSDSDNVGQNVGSRVGTVRYNLRNRVGTEGYNLRNRVGTVNVNSKENRAEGTPNSFTDRLDSDSIALNIVIKEEQEDTPPSESKPGLGSGCNMDQSDWILGTNGNCSESSRSKKVKVNGSGDLSENANGSSSCYWKDCEATDMYDFSKPDSNRVGSLQEGEEGEGQQDFASSNSNPNPIQLQKTTNVSMAEQKPKPNPNPMCTSEALPFTISDAQLAQFLQTPEGQTFLSLYQNQNQNQPFPVDGSSMASTSTVLEISRSGIRLTLSSSSGTCTGTGTVNASSSPAETVTSSQMMDNTEANSIVESASGVSQRAEMQTPLQPEALDTVADDPEEEPLYVNPKQYHRILKRREARARLEAKGLIPKERPKYIHESRHQHALKRIRGEGGRFGPGMPGGLRGNSKVARGKKQSELKANQNIQTVNREGKPIWILPYYPAGQSAPGSGSGSGDGKTIDDSNPMMTEKQHIIVSFPTLS